VEHQVGELLDQSSVFSDAHELRGWDHTTDRMRPAHERLGTDDRAGVEIELRLEVEMQLLVLDRGAEIAEHRQSSRCPAIDLVAVDLHTEPLRLGVEHRDIGEPQWRALVEVVVDDGKSGAGGGDDLEPVEGDGTSHLANTVPREFEYFLPVGSVAGDGELVAGKACQHVVGPEHGGEPFGHQDEQVVAGVVAQGVIHFFETIEVEKDDEEQTVTAASGGRFVDRAFERRAVGEAREPVEPGFTLDALVEHPLAQAGGELFCEVLEPDDVVRLESPARSGASSDDEQADHAGFVAHRSDHHLRDRRPGRLDGAEFRAGHEYRSFRGDQCPPVRISGISGQLEAYETVNLEPRSVAVVEDDDGRTVGAKQLGRLDDRRSTTPRKTTTAMATSKMNMAALNAALNRGGRRIARITRITTMAPNSRAATAGPGARYTRLRANGISDVLSRVASELRVAWFTHGAIAGHQPWSTMGRSRQSRE